MKSHILIALGVFGVMAVEWLWRRVKRRHRLASGMRAARPEEALEEHLSASGRLKVVVYPHGHEVFRVEVFQRMTEDPTEPYWIRTAGPSLVDRGSLGAVLDEALRACSGEAS